MAGRRATPGTRQLNLEVDEKLLERLEAFVAARGQTKRHAVERALTRHMDHPPPLAPDPPLPACEPDPAPTTAKPKPVRKKK